MKTELKLSWFKTLLYFSGAIIIAALGIMSVIYIAEHYYDIGYQSTKMLRYKVFNIVLSIITIIAFGGGGSIALYMLIKHKMKYIIGDVGIEFYSSVKKSFLVTWSEVDEVKVSRIGPVTFIGINILDIDQYKRKNSVFVNKLITQNKRLGCAPIIINLQLVKETPEEVLAIINKYWNEWTQNNEHEKV